MFGGKTLDSMMLAASLAFAHSGPMASPVVSKHCQTSPGGGKITLVENCCVRELKVTMLTPAGHLAWAGNRNIGSPPSQDYCDGHRRGAHKVLDTYHHSSSPPQNWRVLIACFAFLNSVVTDGCLPVHIRYRRSLMCDRYVISP